MITLDYSADVHQTRKYSLTIIPQSKAFSWDKVSMGYLCWLTKWASKENDVSELHTHVLNTAYIWYTVQPFTLEK